MVLLALETATRRGSVALADDSGIHGLDGDASRTHGARLPGELLAIVARQGHGIDDITHGVIVAGPGSFTGLRVGMAAMQGLAFARGLPVVPVPTLDAMAEGWIAVRGAGAVVVACLDAQRGDVFAAAFEAGAGAATVDDAAVVIPPMTGPPDELARRLIEARPSSLLVIVGDGAARYADVFRRTLPAADLSDLAEPLAVSAVRIARRHVDWAVAPDLLRPIYLRRPDSVMARERAQAARPVETAFTFRRATGSDDLAKVEALQRDTFTNPWGAEAIKWELENTDVARLYLMSADSGELVAYCACWMIFDELHINSLAVGIAWRRRGLARRLLQHVFQDAVQAGARGATLEVRSSNDAARRLYEGLGFSVEGVRRDYYQHPREDALILWQRRLADALVGP